MKCNERIFIRISNYDKEVIKKASKFLKISMSEFIKNYALDKAYEILTSEEYRDKEYYNEE